MILILDYILIFLSIQNHPTFSPVLRNDLFWRTEVMAQNIHRAGTLKQGQGLGPLQRGPVFSCLLSWNREKFRLPITKGRAWPIQWSIPTLGITGFSKSLIMCWGEDFLYCNHYLSWGRCCNIISVGWVTLCVGSIGSATRLRGPKGYGRWWDRTSEGYWNLLKTWGIPAWNHCLRKIFQCLKILQFSKILGGKQW